jgi:hypothetical protein
MVAAKAGKQMANTSAAAANTINVLFITTSHGWFIDEL